MPTIRLAGPGDLETVLWLIGFLHDEPALPDPDRGRDAWAAMLAQAGRVILLAEEGGAVIGMADVITMPNLTRGGRPWVSVENVAVAPAHRRTGVGRALFAEIFARAAAGDAYKVQLMSGVERDPAHDFYEALGFERSAQAFKRYL